MTCEEFLKTEAGTQLLTEINSEGFYILKARFELLWAPYELIYSEKRTYQLAFNLIQSFRPKLLIAEEIHKNLTFQIEELGSQASTQTNSDVEGEAENVTSYTGYNVEGDYSKQKATNKNLSTNLTNIHNVNKIDELIKFTNSKIENLYKDIDIEFEKLFRSLY